MWHQEISIAEIIFYIVNFVVPSQAGQYIIHGIHRNFHHTLLKEFCNTLAVSSVYLFVLILNAHEMDG